MFYTLNKLSEDGHCYATRKMLLEKGAELLGVDFDGRNVAYDISELDELVLTYAT